MEPDDLITEWLNMHEPTKGVVGHHVIEYTKGVYIVLAEQPNYRPVYQGWFCVNDKPLENKQYRFLCQKDGLYLYRSVGDYLPEPPKGD